MDIYNFSKHNKVFFCGGTYDDCGIILRTLQANMRNGIENPVHPKELERQERLNKRRARRSGMEAPSFKSWRPKGNGQFNDSVIFVSGGFGFGTKDDSLFEELIGSINKLCELNNSYVVFVRGNNDNPAYFNDGRFSLERVKLAKDYTVVRLDGFDCLCVGGSLPVDRQWKIEHGKRIGKTLYFDGCRSEFKKDVLDEIIDNFNISCIITSDAPTFMPPSVKGNSSKWAKNDKTISADLTYQRLVMDDIYREFISKDKRPYLWCYTSNLVSDCVMCGGIKGVSSSSCSHFDLHQVMMDTFGVGLNGEKIIRNKQYSKKKSNRSIPENHLIAHPDFEDVGGEPLGENLLADDVAENVPHMPQEGLFANINEEIGVWYDNERIYQNVGAQAVQAVEAINPLPNITFDLGDNR